MRTLTVHKTISIHINIATCSQLGAFGGECCWLVSEEQIFENFTCLFLTIKNICCAKILFLVIFDHFQKQS